MKPWIINQLILVSVFSFLVAHAGSEKGPDDIPMAQDLSALALKANQDQIPIMIMYAAETCEYCERLEDDLLGPMHISGNYSDRVIIRKVMIDAVEDIKDFGGKAIDAEDFAFARGIQVTPTLRFVDAEGNQVAPEMVGYNTPEMYASYIEKAIESSRRVIKHKVKNQ